VVTARGVHLPKSCGIINRSHRVQNELSRPLTTWRRFRIDWRVCWSFVLRPSNKSKDLLLHQLSCSFYVRVWTRPFWQVVRDSFMWQLLVTGYVSRTQFICSFSLPNFLIMLKRTAKPDQIVMGNEQHLEVVHFPMLSKIGLRSWQNI